MGKARKVVSFLLVFIFVLNLSMVFPVPALAVSDDNTINLDENNAGQNKANWSCNAEGDIYTITGDVSVEGTNTEVVSTVTLNMSNSDATVKWNALFQGSSTFNGSLVVITGNGGTFELGNGVSLGHAGSGNVIHAPNGSVKIVIEGMVGASEGNAIYATGANASVVIQDGGMAFNSALNNLHPVIDIISTGELLIDDGSVWTLADDASGFAIQTRGNVIITGMSDVSAERGRAINALGTNSVVRIEDGNISSQGGMVIHTDKVGASVIVNGGHVYSETALAARPVIDMSGGGVVSVAGTGKVEARGNNTIAINTSGNVTIGGTAQVTSTTGSAIHTTSLVDISGGFVFSYGTVASDAVDGTYSLNTPSGVGIITVWDQSNGVTTYNYGAVDDLNTIPATADVIWGRSSGTPGILYANGSNTGLFDPGVNVVAPTSLLSIIAETGGSITTGTDGNYMQGDSIVVVAKENNGYTFSGWTSSNGGSFVNANSLSTTFNMPGIATTITANFTYTGHTPDAGTGGSSPSYEITYVELNKSELTLTVGESEALVATVFPSNATDKGLTWSSSDTSIAIVDANGKVTAVKEGSVIITVTASNGHTAICEVMVVLPSEVPQTGDNNGATISVMIVLFSTALVLSSILILYKLQQRRHVRRDII